MTAVADIDQAQIDCCLQALKGKTDRPPGKRSRPASIRLDVPESNRQ